MDDYPAKDIKINRKYVLFLMIPILIILGGLGLYVLLKPAQTKGDAKTVKLIIDREGLYGFTLRDVLGSNENGLDFSKIQLTHKGEPVPLWVSLNDKNQALFRFWGSAPDNFYTMKSVYLLNISGDTSTPRFEPTPETANTLNLPRNGTVQSTYLSSVYLEENEIYSPHAPLNDSWFWKLMGAPGKVEFPIEIVDITPGQAYVILDLWSNTAAPINPDHHIIVSLNEVVICDHSWDGSSTHEVKCTFSTDILRSDNNTLSIQLPGIKDVLAEILYINKIQIEYPTALNLNNGELLFTANENQVSITNIDASIDLFDITDSNQPRWVSSGQPDENLLATISGHRYVAVKSDQFQQVEIEPTILEPNLANTAGADYVVIGDEELLKSALPLMKHRTEQGLTALSAPLNAIYDQFGFGYPDPWAIKKFISHTQTWEIKPRYILLLGDASYDPRGYLTSPNKNRLPTFFINTEYGGYTATDLPFVDINNDELPEIAIGRLPAESPEQVSIAVKKIIDYENEQKSLQGPTKVLLIADGQEPGFLLDAKTFQANIPSTYSVDLFSPSPGSANINTMVADKINNGQGFIVYLGHGSIQMWGKDHIFSVKDVDLLSNYQQLPIFVNMTCLTGLFTHPTIESFSEALLWKEKGGAVGVLAPTSLTLPSDQSFLINALAKYIFIHNTERLGDAVLASWRSIPAGQGRNDVLNTFLLLGDPALIIQRSSNTSK